MSDWQSSSEIFRVLYEDNPTMYFAVDQNGEVVSVNHFGAEQLGYAREELIGRAVTGVFHHDDRTAVMDQLATCHDNPGTVFEWELRKIRRDGSLMWVHERARAVSIEGVAKLVLIVCEDISHRRASEEALRSSRERYRTLYRKTPAMVHSIDRDRRVVDVSERWLQMLGYDREEVIGRKITEFLTEESRRKAEEHVFPEFVRRGEVRDIEFQFVTRSGDTIDVLLSAISENDENGDFERGLAVLEDVTERNRAEAALRRARDELERRVSERTAELERQHAFLRQIIDVDPNFIFAKDREGRFTLVNQAIADAYGTTVEKLLGKTDAEFNPNKEEVEFFRRKDLEVMDTQEELFILEEVITEASGRRKWLQTVKRPLIGVDGTADQVLGAATDITARKEAESRLRGSEHALLRSQEQLRALAGKLLTAQEEERRRLAREIHDDVSQRLAGLAILAGGMEHRLADDSNAEVRGKLQTIHDELGRLAGDMQALSRQLHPSTLESLGLEEALRVECENFSERSGIEVNFESRDVPATLPRETGIVFYRIAQEALHNVARHARAPSATVTLEILGSLLTLSVEDTGVGFDAGPKGAPGLGLVSMEERARLIGADLSIDSAAGRGTIVLLRVPLANVAAALA